MKTILTNFITFFTRSSEDPAKTSATLTGLIIAVSSYIQLNLAPIIPFLNNFYSSPIGHDIETIATCLGMMVGALITIFGLIRKLTNKVESKSGLRIE